MATATTKPWMGRGGDDEDEQQQHRLLRPVDDDCDDHGVVAREVSKHRVSRLAVEGGGDGGKSVVRSAKPEDGDAEAAVHGRRSGRVEGGRTTTLPPPHAWLAVDDTKKKQCHSSSDPAEEEQWMRLLRGGGGRHQHLQQRRSSFSVVRRERAAREAWLDRAWEMKRSWHERNGGAAMDVEEVVACRDLGLELPSDCTVEIQCYGLSGDTSPTHTAASGSSGADSPCGDISSAGEADPTDVKARLKVWAQAVALASTTQLGS